MAMARFFRVLLFLGASVRSFTPGSYTWVGSARDVRCSGAKTDAVLGVLRRVPILGRLAKKKVSEAPAPAYEAPEIDSAKGVEALLDAARDEAKAAKGKGKSSGSSRGSVSAQMKSGQVGSGVWLWVCSGVEWSGVWSGVGWVPIRAII